MPGGRFIHPSRQKSMKLYKINRSNSEISPEEILLDRQAQSKKDLARLEFPVQPVHLYLMAVAMGLFLAASVISSGYYQLVQREKFTARAEENKLRQYLIEAPRGIILDRYGKVLADNSIHYNLVGVFEDFPKDQPRQQEYLELVKEVTKAPASGLEQSFSDFLNRKTDILAEQLTPLQAIRLNALAEKMPGTKLVGQFTRIYPYSESAFHLIGHTGAATQQDENAEKRITAGQTIGKTGIEYQYDEYLRGESGLIAYERNAKGATLEREYQKPSLTGSTLRLTVDADLQRKIYDVLNNFTAPRASGAIGIALQPKTGEVLALVSVPGLNPNNLVTGISADELNKSLSSPRKPFFNRAVSGEYSPGSAIKPFLALAALQKNLIDPALKIDDTEGRITVPNPYLPDQPFIFRDWKTHGFVNMIEAIGNSCNVYFFAIGGGYGRQKGLGVDAINSALKQFGWGAKTGIDLPDEKSGFIPNPDWKEQTKQEPWRIGDTYNLSIGQGYIRTTPIQLAATMAGFANNGQTMKPFVVAEISDAYTNTPLLEQMPTKAENFNARQDQLDIIKQGMRYTVTQGSAQRLGDMPFEVAGKTGSIQTSADLEKTNALFVSFAPYQNPEILLLVFVESGGEGGATAMPLSRQILDWYWQNR
jgi:penicillin-binding protein 2